MTMALAAGPVAAAGASAAEVVEFDMAVYPISHSISQPFDAQAEVVVTTSGLIQRRLGPGGGLTTIGTWLQGGGAPADPSIYEVEFDTTAGFLQGGGPADTDLQLTTSRNAFVFEDGDGVTVWNGFMRIKLVAGSVEQDSAQLILTADNLP